MNDITKANGHLPTTISSKFATELPAETLGSGISGGFGVLGYKGKTWYTSYKGEKKELMRPDGDGPRNSVDVVILKEGKVVSKTWYEKYVDGSAAAPDCSSSNGVTPDAGAPKKQAAVCAVCPKNGWGTALQQDGTMGKGKACKDVKRLAIVPANVAQEDTVMPLNEMLGGPMLTRVPPASLQDLAKYGERLKAMGYPYYQGVITKISFDPKESYPKFVFTPQRPLTDAEADVVIALVKSPQVERILAEEAHHSALPPPAPPEEPLSFAAPLPTQPLPPNPPAAQAAPAGDSPAPVATPQPVTPQVTTPTPPPASTPAAAASSELSAAFNSELDALLAS
jgi:hypothetical protein